MKTILLLITLAGGTALTFFATSFEKTVSVPDRSESSYPSDLAQEMAFALDVLSREDSTGTVLHIGSASVPVAATSSQAPPFEKRSGRLNWRKLFSYFLIYNWSEAESK